MKQFTTTTKVAFAMCLGLAVAGAGAQPGPSDLLRIIVPIGPGSGMDASYRIFADAYSKATGQPVVVENKGGAATAIGVAEVLKSPADGRTLFALTNATVTINPVLGEKLSYDPKDLRPVAAFIRSAAVLAVGPSSPYKTLAEFISAARKKREEVSIAEYGQTYRVTGLRLERQTGVKFAHIPYKSPSEASTNTIGGQVDAMYLETTAAIPLIKAGKLRALAQTSLVRSPMLPDVPTAAESGYPDYSMYIWGGFAVNAKTPEAIVRNIETSILKTIARDDFRKTLQDRGSETLQWDEKEFADAIQKELAVNTEAVKGLNVR